MEVDTTQLSTIRVFTGNKGLSKFKYRPDFKVLRTTDTASVNMDAGEC